MRGKNVLVLGLGRRGGGVGVARWAAREGANVVVTDLGSEHALDASVQALADFPVRFTLGRHDPADVEWADLIVRNPAVPDSSWVLARARELGKPVAMEMALFLRATGAPVIGITGSKGKTTTSYAAHHLVASSFPRAKLVGNMGISALDSSDLESDGIAVAEISSFQAEGMAELRIAPGVFVVTNLLEDHLDRYPGVKEYHQAKAAILDYQGPEDWAILPSRSFERDRLEALVRGHRAYFESDGEPLPPGADGVYFAAGQMRARWTGDDIDLLSIEELPAPGAHYASNAAAAACAALAIGVEPAAIRDRLHSLPRLAHRQELVATVDGVDYVNDTTATMPAATSASVKTYADRDLVLVAGGASKELDPSPLAQPVAEAVRAVVLLDGTATEGIAAALQEEGFSAIHGPYDSMAPAVAKARSLIRPGGVVLLAPGAASFGMFTDEFDRGTQFREAVLMGRGQTRS